MKNIRHKILVNIRSDVRQVIVYEYYSNNFHNGPVDLSVVLPVWNKIFIRDSEYALYKYVNQNENSNIH